MNRLIDHNIQCVQRLFDDYERPIGYQISLIPHLITRLHNLQDNIKIYRV